MYRGQRSQEIRPSQISEWRNATLCPRLDWRIRFSHWPTDDDCFSETSLNSIPFVSFVIAQKCYQHMAVKFKNDHVVLLMERFLHQMFPFCPRPLNRSLHICNEKYPAHFVCCSFTGAEFHFQRYLFWRVLFKWSRLNLLRKDQCCMKGKITEFDLFPCLNC